MTWLSSVSLIGTYVKRDSTLKLTSMSAGCNRIFWIFWLKSIELMMCVLDFTIRGFSSLARKRERLYVGEFMALTIGLRGLSGLCIFGRPYSLGEREFVGLNVNLILLGKLLFFIKVFFARLCLLGFYQVLCMPCPGESLYFFCNLTCSWLLQGRVLSVIASVTLYDHHRKVFLVYLVQSAVVWKKRKWKRIVCSSVVHLRYDREFRNWSYQNAFTSNIRRCSKHRMSHTCENAVFMIDILMNVQ